MAVDGRFDHIELQDNIIYETIETKPTAQEKDLWKKQQSDVRRYKRVGVGVGLLCAVLALLNVAVPLYLYQSNVVEREQLVKMTKERDQLLDRINNMITPKKSLCESDGFTFGGGLCYYISTEKTTWWKSREWCKSKRSDLMVIKSKEKQDFVERVNKTVWLGLIEKCGKGPFEWVDGTRLTTPKYWYPGRPHHLKEQQPNKKSTHRYCVEFLVNGLAPDTRGWNDVWCQSTNPWICERVL